jgi:uncharacterized RDD family membrane protein YckC
MWYYVAAGRQIGPIKEAEWAEWVRTGKIQPDTLVWRAGLAQWQPYRAVAQPPSPPPGTEQPQGAPAPPAGEVVCSECHNPFPRDKATQYGTAWVCANCKPRFVRKFQWHAVLPAGAAGLAYAGFWIRFVAKLLDGFILGAVFGGPVVFFFLATGWLARLDVHRELTPALLALEFILMVLNVAVVVAYRGFFVGSFGATPGKMVLGLKVVAPDGSKVGYGRAFGRALAEFLSRIICFIGYLIAAFDTEKRTLHDYICDTRVIYHP